MAVVRKAKPIDEGLKNSAIKAIEAANAFAHSEELEPLKCDSNMTIMLPKSVKNEWKAFFAARGLTLSFGVKVAVDHLMADVTQGKGDLRITGYTAK